MVSMPARPDDELLANATRVYLAGSSMAAVAREFRLPVRQLTQHLDRLGVKRRMTVRDRARFLSGNNPRRTDVTVAEVAELYRSGWTVVRLAERFQCHRSVIERRLRAAGVPRHSQSAAIRFGNDLAKAKHNDR
jgi:hypothetical protein